MYQLLSIILINIIVLKYFIQISNFINLFDLPDKKRKIHLIKIAPIGGFIIVLNFSILFFFSYLENNINNINISIFIFGIIFFIIGFFDDKYNLNSILRIFLYTLICLILIEVNEKINITELNFIFLDKLIYLGNYSKIFTIFCFLIFLNAFNMYDGINLQSSTYSILIFLIFIFKQFYVSLSIVIIISLIFFIILNYKNKCFLGNNGSLFLAFLISYIFVESSKSHLFYADEILLIMLIPGLDLIRLFFERIKKKQNPFLADRNHIHHLLLSKYNLIKTNFILIGLVLVPYIFGLLINNFLLLNIIISIIYFVLILKLKKNVR